MHALGLELAVQPNRLKGRVMCGTVHGEMHLKDLLGSFIRVGYRIPVPDFYLVLHGLRCRKSTIMDQTKPNFPLVIRVRKPSILPLFDQALISAFYSFSEFKVI